jgi:RNA polymerase sigma factor (sigma-70 family)
MIPAEQNAELVCAPVSTRRLLEDFARRYYAPLLSFFRKRTRNAAEVPDLVQQVFLRLSQYRELGRIQNPDGFIFQTAANILKDYHRNTAVREQHAGRSDGAIPATDSDFSPERVLLGEQALERLVDALRQLPERTRDVFIFRCFDGLRNAEIAQLLGISIRAVEKHMVRALAHVGQAIDVGSGARFGDH